jgi:ribonuclease HI
MHFNSVYDGVKWPDQLDAAYAKQITIYADGSCWNVTGQGAYAARIEYFITALTPVALHYVWGHLDDVTNQIAEMTAIYQGLLAVPAHITDAQVVVISDSEWALRCLTGEYKPRVYHDDPRINWGMIKAQAARFNSVRWQHTKGHAGTLGNEECDMLCEAARKNVLITEKIFDQLMARAKAKSR